MKAPTMSRHFLEIPLPRDRSKSPSPKETTLCLQKVNILEEFSVIKTLSEGSFSKILLVRQNRERLVLKAIHCELTTAEDFARELNYNYFLSPHPSIVTCYQVAFSWDNCFLYVQEYAQYGDLSRLLRKGGLPECQVKSMAQQLTSALDFIHSFSLVHRAVIPDNILVYKKDLSVVKLCDFSDMRPIGTLLTKKPGSPRVAYESPELSCLLPQERYHCDPSEDVWQMGIVLITCLFGGTPWNCADITDPSYCQYVEWIKRKSLRVPEQFQFFTQRFERLLKRLLEPKANKRSKITEVSKYLNDEWVQGSHAARRISLERHESNATSKSGQRQKYSKKRSTKSLLLAAEVDIDNCEESVTERVGKWIDSAQTCITNNERKGSVCVGNNEVHFKNNCPMINVVST